MTFGVLCVDDSELASFNDDRDLSGASALLSLDLSPVFNDDQDLPDGTILVVDGGFAVEVLSME